MLLNICFNYGMEAAKNVEISETNKRKQEFLRAELEGTAKIKFFVNKIICLDKITHIFL